MEARFLLGSMGITILLSIILRFVYFHFDIENKRKPLIAVSIGLALAIVSLFYNLSPDSSITFRMVIDYLERGFLEGASAVGLYELSKQHGS